MISIIVPVYNSEEYLDNCLQSIISQSYSDLEIILINDGSTDHSHEVLRKYQAIDKRIVIISQENEGQGIARNAGLDIAKGDFISFVDSDDKLSLDVYESIIKQFEIDRNLDVVQFPVFMNYGTEKQELVIKKESLIISTKKLFEEWIENSNISWLICNKVFKREVFDNLRFSKMYFEDNFIHAEILDRIKSLQIIEKGIYYYYNRKNSTTTSPSNFEKERDTQLVNYRIYESLQRNNSENGKVIMQERILNVAISLKKNYNKKFHSFNKNEINLFYVICSKIAFFQKIKLLLFRFIGTRFFEQFYR